MKVKDDCFVPYVLIKNDIDKRKEERLCNMCCDQ